MHALVPATTALRPPEPLEAQTLLHFCLFLEVTYQDPFLLAFSFLFQVFLPVGEGDLLMFLG